MATRSGRSLRLLIPLLALLGCAPLAVAQGAADSCATAAFALRADYPGARLSVCEVVSADEVTIHIHAEDGGKINPSPWYGFHVRAVDDAGPGPSSANGKLEALTVRLRYGGEHRHRYHPKISIDGQSWRRLPENAVQVADGEAVLRLRPDADGFFVSAGENWNNAFYMAWRERIGALAGAPWREIGKSLGGRAIHALHIHANAPNVVLLLGRQHPPEVSGAISMTRFVERLLQTRAGTCAEPRPSCRFFQTHGFVVVPLLNPDGVAAGHWRHNLGQTDLNRDWGPFTQPETQAVRDLVAGLEAQRRRLRLVLDFHSTRRNVFFTQDAASPTRPLEFAARWLAAARRKDGLYEFTNDPRPLTQTGTAKNYFHRRFGIPSVTFEVADEENRALVASSAAAFADAMVETLVAVDAAPPPPCTDFFCHMANANAASLVMLAEEGLLDAQLAARIADAAAWVVEEQARPGAARTANYLPLEKRLVELAGVAAANVHMGRSRQDLHGAARRMVARGDWLAALRELLRARAAIIALAEAHADAPVPAYTHGVQAQPTTFGHYLLAFSAGLRRDAERLMEGYRRLNRSPLGAAALGTSGFPLNRQRLATLLGFDAPVENSYDANLVSTADYKLELAGALAQSAVTVGQFAQDIHAQYQHPRPWIVLDPAVTSISTIMPQKRNPRPLDRLRSAASAVLAKAHAVTLATHNTRTGMHDYRRLEPLRELAAEAQQMYRRYTALAGAIGVDRERARQELDRGFATMTEVADTLLREADVPFRTAHAYASALTDLCRAQARAAKTLTDAELRDVYREVTGARLPLAPAVIRGALDPAALIAARRGFGGPQPAEMRRSLAAHRESLAAQEGWLGDTEGALTAARVELRAAFDKVRFGAEGADG